MHTVVHSRGKLWKDGQFSPARTPPRGHIGAPLEIPLWRLRGRTPLCPSSQAAPSSSSTPPVHPPTERHMLAATTRSAPPACTPVAQPQQEKKKLGERDHHTTTKQHRPGSGRSREQKKVTRRGFKGRPTAAISRLAQQLPIFVFLLCLSVFLEIASTLRAPRHCTHKARKPV